MLVEKQVDEDSEDRIMSQKTILTLLISPFWINLTKNEVKQLISLRSRYWSIWNIIDATSLISAALVIFASF